MDKAAKELDPAEEPAAPNYEMDEFDRLNLFYDEFRPDAEPPPSPPPSPSPEEEEGGDDDGDFLSAEEEEEEAVPPPPSQDTQNVWEAPAATPFHQSSSESTDLGTVKQLITKFSKNPGYRVKSGKFNGKSVEDLNKVRDEILRRRGELPLQPAQSPLDDASRERETEGSGLGASNADKLINQLCVSLGSVKAGNTSTKLRA